MKTATHGNGNGLDDLYILPESEQERQRIADYLKSRGISYEWSYSDVEGQDWHGKHFFELPFGEGLLGVIQQAVNAPRYRCNFAGRRVGAHSTGAPGFVFRLHTFTRKNDMATIREKTIVFLHATPSELEELANSTTSEERGEIARHLEGVAAGAAFAAAYLSARYGEGCGDQAREACYAAGWEHLGGFRAVLKS